MKKIYISIILLIMIIACGCGVQEEEDKVNYFYTSMNDKNTEKQDEDSLSESNITDELYLVVKVDSVEETIRVYRYANGLEYQYYYGLETQFLNKYGDYMSVANLEVGDIINILGVDSTGKATTVQMADSVWNYEDITKFSVDEDAGIMQIAGNKYSIAEDCFVFVGDERASFSDISSQDELAVIGVDKKILSVSVTTGHGTLQLENTQLFEGSYLQLGTRIFVEITPAMQMEVPEGEYTLAVANDGWGGSKEITIVQGETTVVDLDEIKGDGPKYCSIQFVVDVEGAQIYLDNELVDYSQVNQVRYGNHSLTVVADGYDTWKRTLCVNSAEATIIISLTSESDDTEDSSENSQSNGSNNSDSNNSNSSNNGTSSNNSNNSNNNKNNNNNNNSSNSSNSSTNNSITNEQLTDYLSTLSSLVSSIY